MGAALTGRNGPAFTASANRDAYATIRGFVYQAERTMLAWLKLSDSQFLLCEAGEDIDWVRLPVDTAMTPERLLEQVKHREKALTLRSPIVFDALGNYLGAVANNPGWQITFRLFTNADTAKEDLVRFPRDLHGIDAWQHAVNGSFNVDEMSVFVTQLRKVLVSPPASARPESTARLIQFLDSSDDERVVSDLVRPFEWAIRAPPAAALQPEIELCLSKLGLHGPAMYPRVLLHVLRQRSSRGPKRFDLLGLNAVLATGAIAGAEQTFFEALSVLLAKSETALAEIAGGVKSILDQQTASGQQMLLLQSRVESIGGSIAQVVLRAGLDEPPPMPALFALRAELVADIRTSCANGGWVNVVASSNMGKSQLARVVFETKRVYGNS